MYDCSTSFYLKDLSGKKIAIFKPDDMGSRGPRNLKQHVRIIGWCRTHLLKQVTTRQSRKHKGQLLSFKISQKLGVHMVAPTKISKISSTLLGIAGDPQIKKGSLQAWIPNAKLSHEVLGMPPGCKGRQIFQWLVRSLKDWALRKNALETTKRILQEPSAEALKNVPKELFQLFAIYDFIIGEVDRKYGNWMLLLPSENKEGTEKKSSDRVFIVVDKILSLNEGQRAIVAIDGDAALPKGRTKYGETKSQYLWAELSIAKECFSEEVKRQYNKQSLQVMEQGIVDDIVTEMLEEDMPMNTQEIGDVKALMMDCITKWIDEKKMEE